ncbi:hypothetical protein HZA57_01575, partial [Candidatus Poribacteria bacterium]|nr:hypothetical protein [Candidatus Poribacteria bacterium]
MSSDGRKDFQEPPMPDHPQRPHIWSTLAEYEGDPDVLARMGGGDWNTKPEGFADKIENLTASEIAMRRRTFLKLGGFAAVLAVANGCQKPAEKILPYVHAPEEVVPGVANYYASTCMACPAACGILVKTREGRPIKLEGNADHPVNRGAMCSRGQASVLDLYDPDRLRNPQKSDGTSLAWEAADELLVKALKDAGPRAVLLTGTIHGPARRALLRKFQTAFPGLRHIVFDPLNEETGLDALEEALGERVLPRHHFGKSEVTVLLGADPMAEGVSPVEFMGGIAGQRMVRKDAHGKNVMGRLYAFEPVMTMSGMNADYRFKVLPEELLDVARGIAAQIAVQSDTRLDSVSIPDIESRLELPAGTIQRVAEDLWANKGKCLVYAGGMAGRTGGDKALHHAVNLINHLLGNFGGTIDLSRPGNQSQGGDRAMLELIGDMNAGKVDVLLVSGVNPGYALPESAGFASAMNKVKTKVSFAPYKDETAQLCDLLLPGVHALENWGDTEPYEGVLGI